MAEDRKFFASKQEVIDKAGKLKREYVGHPDGGGVYVREMMARERDRYEQWVMDIRYDDKGKVTRQKPILQQARAKLCVLTMVGPDGERYFADDDVSEVDTLGAAYIDKCFAVARRLNGLSEEDIEELVGNSDGDRPES